MNELAVKECLGNKFESERYAKVLENKLPMEVLVVNVKALKELFDILGFNTPKEQIILTAITTTQRMTGYDFEEVKLLIDNSDDETYYTVEELCKMIGIKRVKANLAFAELGLQVEGSISSRKMWTLTKLGKKYGIEVEHSINENHGYEIKFKKSVLEYVKENLNKLPVIWIK